MVEKFEDVQIDGAFIRELVLVPSSHVRISLLRAPQADSESQVSVLSDLHFQDVQSCNCGFNANPWLEIKSHATLLKSESLKMHLPDQRGDASGPEICHFQIICDEGEINILARRFTVRVVEEIPHRGTSEE
jgi:hypothetical protein